MRIKGLTLAQFEDIAAGVSRRDYAGNIAAVDGRDTSNSRGGRCIVRISAVDSRGAGARRSASGRHGPWACWHAHRDVLAAVFAVYPEAEVRTGFAVYEGREGFERTFPSTYHHDVGPISSPRSFGELCDCTG